MIAKHITKTIHGDEIHIFCENCGIFAMVKIAEDKRDRDYAMLHFEELHKGHLIDIRDIDLNKNGRKY